MKDGRVKKSAQNMVMGFIYQAVTLILSFVSRTVFIQVLGREYLGLNGIFSDVLTLLSMADLGFNTAMAYSFYKPLAERDERQLISLVDFYKKIYNVIALVVLILGLACIPFLDYLVNTEQDIPLLEVYYLFALANVVISYLFVYKTTILTADQKDYMIVKIRMLFSVLKVVLQMVLLWITKNYVLYLAIGVIAQFIINFIASQRTEKEFPFLRKKELIQKVNKEVTNGIIANMKSVFIYKMSTTLFTATDNILISVIVGTAMVGVYSNYLMVSSKLLLLEQIVFSALTASIGNLIVKETQAKRLEIFNAMQSASFIFCGVISSVFCLMANDFVKVWLGESFALSTVTVLAITLNTYLACVLQPLWTFRDAAGLYIKTKYIMLTGAVLNIVLSIIFGHLWGITGIIFASAVARLSTYFWYEPKLLFKEYLGSKVSGYYGSLIKNLCLVALSVYGLSFVSKEFVATNWGTLIIKGVIIGGICGVIFMLAYCRTEGFRIIWRKAKAVLLRKG
ncbi:MAG: hypothetical protein IJY09_02250 [Lachnospiraceae bacterium]|nr:hypothetical protein [Lachnospiraceae bacterium]